MALDVGNIEHIAGRMADAFWAKRCGTNHLINRQKIELTERHAVGQKASHSSRHVGKMTLEKEDRDNPDGIYAQFRKLAAIETQLCENFNSDLESGVAENTGFANATRVPEYIRKGPAMVGRWYHRNNEAHEKLLSEAEGHMRAIIEISEGIEKSALPDGAKKLDLGDLKYQFESDVRQAMCSANGIHNLCSTLH